MMNPLGSLLSRISLSSSSFFDFCAQNIQRKEEEEEEEEEEENECQ